MTKDLNPLELAVLKTNVGIRRSQIGQSEFAICLRKAREKNPDAGDAQLVSLITDEIDARWLAFANGESNLKTEQWKRVHSESEAAARDELLKDSTGLKRVTELFTKSKEAK